MPNLQRRGPCLNFAHFTMQFCNPSDPKGGGGPWHNAPPPLNTPLVTFLAWWDDGILWCGFRFLPTNSEVKTKKKVFSAKSSFVLAFPRVFLSWNENLLMPGRHKQYFGKVQALKCTSVAPGLLVSFGAQSSLGGHISRLGGISCDLGVRPEMLPHGARPA